MTSAATLTCTYASLVNRLGWDLYGLRPASTDVITDGVASANQATDILNCLRDGLSFVYGAYRWSFMRPRLSITTYPSYSTGTVTVDASGNVTLTGGTFPSYSASAAGQLWIPYSVANGTGGSFQVATYSSSTAIVLANYTGGAITSPSTFNLTFNLYPLPTGFDSFQEQLTFPPGVNVPARPISRVDEGQIRAYLERDNTPGLPQMYALVTNTFDPTAGSQRSVVFYPIPGKQHTLTALATLRPLMLDATNQYPLGGEILGPVLMESVLAAGERNMNEAMGVHNQAVQPLLAMAIAADKDRATAETLGVDFGQGEQGSLHHHHFGAINWNAGGGYVGPLG